MSVAPIIRDLRRLVIHKIYEAYPSHIHYRVLVPIGETIEALLTVPPGYVYIVPGEIHDVPSDTFTHKCIKDDKPILPETLIDGTSMVMNYSEPMVVERYWHGWVKNVSNIYSPPGADTIFRLRVPLLVCPRPLYEAVKAQSEVIKEIEEIFAAIWIGLKPEEKVKLVKKLMVKAPEVLVAVAR